MCISWAGAPSLIPGLMNMSPETLKVGDTVSVQLTLQTQNRLQPQHKVYCWVLHARLE